jgi:hypothetical protein
MSYNSDVKIDPNALDDEWLRQADLMRKYSVQVADFLQQKERAEEELNVCKADLDKDIRSDPDGYNITAPKITETVIINTIYIQAVYRDAAEKVSDVTHEWNVAKAMVTSIDHKKTALECLVKLHGQSYFAGPKVPKTLGSTYFEEKHQKNVDSKVRISKKSKMKRGE